VDVIYLPNVNFSLEGRPLRKSKKLKREILHCVQNDKKRRFVILEEPTATKDLAFFWGNANYAKLSLEGVQ